MTSALFFTGAVQFLVLLLGITAREAARSRMAAICGDPTAAQTGRVSLNPLRHLDFVGSLMLPALLIAFGRPVFGWGRPLPIQVANLTAPRRQLMWIVAAGVSANVLISALATIGLAIAVSQLGPEAKQVGTLSLLHQIAPAANLPGFPVIFTLVQLAHVNAFLVLFNLLPLPPLDGGLVVLHLLPPDWAAKYARLHPYGLTIAIFLGVAGLLNLLLLPFTVLLNMIIQL